MSEQPKALSIVNNLESEFVTGRVSNHTGRKAAVELHRLHAVELEALELRAKLSQEKEVVAALLAEQGRLQRALNKRHAQVERLQAEVNEQAREAMHSQNLRHNR